MVEIEREREQVASETTGYEPLDLNHG